MTLRYGVIGHPVHHSRSPAMHRAAFDALAIDATYDAIEVAPDELDAWVATSVFDGLNVTLPHKQSILSLVDEVEPDALAIGAVNTVARERGRLIGLNTDAPGLARALSETGLDVRDTRCVVLGAGGAARAAVMGLDRAGARAITVAARRPDAASSLVRALAGVATADLGATDLAALRDVLAKTDLVVQATSATLGGGPRAEALARALPFDALPSRAVVTDLVYEPLRTTVLAAAEARGLATVGGLGMLLHQGALAFERWLGRPAPLDAMRDALRSRP